MLNELAHLGLNVALTLALFGTVLPLAGATLGRKDWMQLALSLIHI